MISGGETKLSQKLAMRGGGGCDIMVATAGRLVEHVTSGSIKLDRVTLLVIDEVDKMLELGFEPEMRTLLTHPRLPPAPERQTVMVSATLPNGEIWWTTLRCTLY